MSNSKIVSDVSSDKDFNKIRKRGKSLSSIGSTKVSIRCAVVPESGLLSFPRTTRGVLDVLKPLQLMYKDILYGVNSDTQSAGKKGFNSDIAALKQWHGVALRAMHR